MKEKLVHYKDIKVIIEATSDPELLYITIPGGESFYIKKENLSDEKIAKALEKAMSKRKLLQEKGIKVKKRHLSEGKIFTANPKGGGFGRITYRDGYFVLLPGAYLAKFCREKNGKAAACDKLKQQRLKARDGKTIHEIKNKKPSPLLFLIKGKNGNG